MANIHTFITAVFKAGGDVSSSWIIDEQDGYYKATSGLVSISIRKRASHPGTFLTCEGSKLYAGYGSQQLGKQVLDIPLDRVPESLYAKGEFLLLVADCATGMIEIQRDALSTLPLFAGKAQDQLIISNHYEQVYTALEPSTLSLNAYSLSMSLAGAATGEPLFNEIITLYDRMRLVWNSLSYKRILPPDGSMRSRVYDRGGNGHEFMARYDATLQRYYQTYTPSETAGVELSCGMDSSSIAGFYAENSCAIKPASLTYSGSSRASIESRLQDFEQRFSVASERMPMEPATDYPLSHLISDNHVQPFFTEDEIYTPSISRMADYFQKLGIKTVYRGLGGDELFENYPSLLDAHNANPLFPRLFKPPAYLTHSYTSYTKQAGIYDKQKPVPLLSPSVTGLGLSTNNLYIDRDIWPVLPLADVDLYFYCQSLPMRYRYKRNVLRAYLHAKKFPDSIHSPVKNENFGSFFNESVPAGLTAVFMNLMRNSVTADMGLVDKQAAINQWQQASAAAPTSTSPTDLLKLYWLIKIEANLQNWQDRLAKAARV